MMNSSNKNGSNGDSTAAGKIEHVVVLMFENRSFDHILGAMHGVNGLLGEDGAVKPEFYNTLDPAKEPGDQNPAVRPTAIVRAPHCQQRGRGFGLPRHHRRGRMLTPAANPDG